jgi:hypothetical protein
MNQYSILVALLSSAALAWSVFIAPEYRAYMLVWVLVGLPFVTIVLEGGHKK